MKVIGFCGLPGSGKTTALLAVSNLGIIITMGDVVRDEAKKRNSDEYGENLGEIARDMRKQHGPGIIAHKCVGIIKSLKEEVIFVDGVRSVEEVKVFRKYWKFPLVSIEMDENLRITRLKERARVDDSKEIDEIKKRDKRESEFGLNTVIEIADYRITNNSSKNALEKETLKLVKKIIRDY